MDGLAKRAGGFALEAGGNFKAGPYSFFLREGSPERLGYFFGGTEVLRSLEPNPYLKCNTGSEIFYARPEGYSLRTRIGESPSFEVAWKGNCILVEGDRLRVEVFDKNRLLLSYTAPWWEAKIAGGRPSEEVFSGQFPLSIAEADTLEVLGVEAMAPRVKKPADFGAEFLSASELNQALATLEMYLGK
ncbi:MAG: hypothetical protein JW727_00510 [Candidatus Aenigmarchaeota archaeon]|nr:hypothetical protein [Candidatus Aenigmarchaeota archaeon]